MKKSELRDIVREELNRLDEGRVRGRAVSGDKAVKIFNKSSEAIKGYDSGGNAYWVLNVMYFKSSGFEMLKRFDSAGILPSVREYNANPAGAYISEGEIVAIAEDYDENGRTYVFKYDPTLRDGIAVFNTDVLDATQQGKRW